MFIGHMGPIPSGLVHPMPGIVYGGSHTTQNVIMINQSAKEVKIPGGTVIGTATAMNNPSTPQLISNMGHLSEVEETTNEEQHVQHVYQLATEPQVRARVNKLWQELDTENPDKNLSKEGRKAMYKILERHLQVFTDEEVKVGCTD